MSKDYGYPEAFGLFRYGDTLSDEVQAVVDELAGYVDDMAHGRSRDAKEAKLAVLRAAHALRADA